MVDAIFIGLNMSILTTRWYPISSVLLIFIPSYTTRLSIFS